MKDKLKNTLEHEVELLGRSISILALAGLLLIGGGSAALLTSFGTIDGEANVQQAVVLDGKDDGTFEWSANDGDVFDVVAGDVVVGDPTEEGEAYDSFTVETNLEEGYDLTYDHNLNEDDSMEVEDSTQFYWDNNGEVTEDTEDAVVRTTYANYFADVASDTGADQEDVVSGYDADASVSSASDLEDEVGSESVEIIEVTGTISEDFTVDSPVTIVSNGETVEGTMTIAASTGSVTVEGLTFEDGYPEEDAIYIEADNDVELNNVEVTDSDDGSTDDWSRAVHTEADNTDLVINNSEFTDTFLGVYERARSVTVENTVMTGIEEAGVAMASGDVSVENSEISVDPESSGQLASVRYGPDSDSASERTLTVEDSHLYSESDDSNYYAVRTRGDEDNTATVSSSRLDGGVLADDSSSVTATQNFFAEGTWEEADNSNIVGDVDASYQTVDSVEVDQVIEVAPVHEFNLMATGQNNYQIETQIS